VEEAVEAAKEAVEMVEAAVETAKETAAAATAAQEAPAAQGPISSCPRNLPYTRSRSHPLA
jgi:hypothetical protein